ncbi:MAG: hypothetical protein WCB99_07545 [Candidatus Cybelea sp.]|jgi:hypothetical protein
MTASSAYARLAPSSSTVISNPLPVANLAIKGVVGELNALERSEPVYGGYANGRGEIVLFARDLAYRIDFKNQILKPRPPLNEGAQARYDATEAGEDFAYGNKVFRRLSHLEIRDICTAGLFRVGSRF